MPRIPPLRGVFALSAILAASAATPPAASAVELMGVSLAGAEFGNRNLPGTFDRHYTYPDLEEVDSFIAEGLNSFRLPFRWERLQRSARAELDATELGRMDEFINGTTARGATVVLDPHNFARYFPDPNNVEQSSQGLIGSAEVPNEVFADFWSKLATHYAGNDKVVFGLMNEPNSMPTPQWVSAANAALEAIRDTGAENLVLVPGTRYTGAHSWNQSDSNGISNAEALLDITDPANNVAFEVHQYLDSDFSGRTAGVQSETIGVDSLQKVTDWLIANDKRAYLGEFAAAASAVGDGPDQIGDEAVTLMLEHLEENDEHWIGWAWWAAGPWWNDYMFDLNTVGAGSPDREAGGTEANQLAVLRPFLQGNQVPEPTTAVLALAGGCLLLRRRGV